MNIYLPKRVGNAGSYAPICQWIVNTWAKVSISIVIRAFTKVGIIIEQPSDSNETGLNCYKSDLGMLDVAITKLSNADTEHEEFNGLIEERNDEKVNILYVKYWQLLLMI